MENKLIYIAAICGASFFAGSVYSQTTEYTALVKKSSNRLGAKGYAPCAAATITMNSLVARGDDLGRLAPNVQPFTNFIIAVKADLITKGTTASTLDSLVNASSKAIMSSPDPVLKAMKDFDKCYEDALR